MSLSLSRIQNPELLIGFVAPIGADMDPTIESFRDYFRGRNYEVVEIKVTDIFKAFAQYVKPKVKLRSAPLHDRYKTYIQYGNQLRANFNTDTFLAATAIGTVARRRAQLAGKIKGHVPFEKTAFLIHQFKRKEEIDLLRSVYGRLFFQVSIYSRRGTRVDSLAQRFCLSEGQAQPERYRAHAEGIVQTDQDEYADAHGQRVGRIFHDADLIVSNDAASPTVKEQVHRFCEILFSSNSYSPSKIEYGMFCAKAAALRTLDLSRQVGAAIFSEAGEVVSLGCNEVPKAGGGSYDADDSIDARDYRRGFDANDRRKQQLLMELAKILKSPEKAERVLSSAAVRDSQFMDALEYSRVTHAEMSAISDAARLGRPVKNCILFTTTFPCHMCAKHIIAAGVTKVVFLEPYPKSLAAQLHGDALQIESSDRGEYSGYPSVCFEHFYGVTPRRFRELFERGKRKDESGNFLGYIDGQPRANIDIKQPFYAKLEETVLEQVRKLVKEDTIFD